MPAATDDGPTVALSFANNFWGKDDAGVGPLLERMVGAKQTCDELRSFYNTRASIEDEYARKLLSLCKKPLGSHETGSLKNSLDTVRGEVESMAKQHQSNAAQMKSELEEPLAAFAGAMKERRKIVQHGIEKLLKLKIQQTQHVNKTRDRYEQECLKIKGYLAQGHMVMGQEERKNKAKLEKTQISLAASNTEYENAVKALEDTTARWNREWKAAADKFQDLEEERLDFTKSCLWTFANISSTVCVSDDASCEKIRLSLEKLDVENDITTFITERGTGQEIPDPPKYINFCRGDVDSQSEASDNDYSVAQFPRSINPAFRSSSPQPSTFESHHDPNSALARELGHGVPDTPPGREETLTPQKVPAQKMAVQKMPAQERHARPQQQQQQQKQQQQEPEPEQQQQQHQLQQQHQPQRHQPQQHQPQRHQPQLDESELDEPQQHQAQQKRPSQQKQLQQHQPQQYQVQQHQLQQHQSEQHQPQQHQLQQRQPLQHQPQQHQPQQPRYTKQPEQKYDATDFAPVPHDPYPMDGMTMLCRTRPGGSDLGSHVGSHIDSQLGSLVDSQLGSQVSANSGRPSSRASNSDYSNPTSLSSMEPPSGKTSPVKQEPPHTPSDKSLIKKKSGFFQNHSPFRRKSMKDVQPSPSTFRNTWHPSQQSSRGQVTYGGGGETQKYGGGEPQKYGSGETRKYGGSEAQKYGGSETQKFGGGETAKYGGRESPKKVAPRSASPDPIDANASLALNVGQNVFSVATPSKQDKEAAASPPEDDPIALALAELKGVTGGGLNKLSSVRVSADHYHGLATPAPGVQPLSRVAASVRANDAVTAGMRGTPPPSYDQQIQRLGVPAAACTSRAMKETSQKFVSQTRNMFNHAPPQSISGGYGTPTRPPTRGADVRADVPRSASPAPPRSTSPRPGTVAGSQRSRHSVSANPNTTSERSQRSASPNPYAASERNQRSASPNPYAASERNQRSASPNPYAASERNQRSASPNPYAASERNQRAASPNPYAASERNQRSASPNPYAASERNQRSVSPNPYAPSERNQRSASPNPYAASERNQRSASPNPYAASERNQHTASPSPYAGSERNSPASQQQRTGSYATRTPHRGSDQGYYQRNNSSHDLGARSASPASYRPGSSQVQNDMSVQLAPVPDDLYGGSQYGGSQYGGSQRGRGARPGTASGHRGLNLYEGAGPVRTRSKSVADTSRQYTRDGRPIIHFARALYMYQAAIPEELGFAKGDVLAVLRHQDDGWWEAEVHGGNGQVGLVPSNYLQAC